MSIAVVTVNYRTPRLAVDCLSSIARERASLLRNDPSTDLRAFFVDNDSGDGSLGHLDAAVQEAGWSPWVNVIAAGRNGGFAFGNNIGIRAARAAMPDLSCIVLLNPDAQFRPGALAALIDFLEEHPAAGIVGPGIDNAEGKPESSSHTFPSPLGELEGTATFGPLSALLSRWAVSGPLPQAPTRCDWVSGACMALRPSVLDSAGLMDEGYFLYFEETDLCFRAAKAGWECWTLPSARVLHLEGAATGIRARRKRRSAFWYESRRRFFATHYGVAGLVAADALWALGRASLRLRLGLGLGRGGGRGGEPARLAADLLGGDAAALLGGRLRSCPRKALK